MRSRTASCLCGQLRIDVQGEPGVGVCHCLACQRRTGSVFATLAGFAAPYEVSGNATEYVHVAVGAFADPSFPAPEDSVYECRKHAWVQLPPGAKGYDKDPD